MLRISVIMPVFNAEAFVEKAVISALEQSIPDLELLCIDDCSTDNSAQIIKSFGNKLKYIKTEQNGGAAAARNLGLSVASGSFIAFLDADDRFAPDALSSQLHCYLNAIGESRVVVLGKSKVSFNGSTPPENYFLNREDGDEFFLSVLGALLVPAEIVNEIGGFDASLKFNDDIDWFMRLKDRNVTILRNDRTVLYVLRHGQNLTSDSAETSRAHLELFRRRIKSKR